MAALGLSTLTPRPDTHFAPTGSPVASDNTWHHLVVTDDGAGNATMYYRSASDAEHLVLATNYNGTTGGAGGEGGGIFDIGRIGGGGFPASGMVDDVAVFNRVLTQAEAEGIYAAGGVAAAIPGLDATFSPGDLHAYWKLDGNLTDSIGSSDASFVDQDGGGVDVSYQTGFNGVAGGALDFHDTTDHVATPYITHTGTKSLSLFFTTQANTFAQQMAGEASDNRFYFGCHHPTPGGGSLVGGLGAGSVLVRPETDFVPPGGMPVVPDNTWHHLVATDDGAGNGAMHYRSPRDSRHVVYTWTYGGTSGGLVPFMIGAFAGGGWPLSGMVDDVAVFDRVLTSNEVETIYYAGSVAPLIVQSEKGTLWVVK
jgi:hypothetical protein